MRRSREANAPLDAQQDHEDGFAADLVLGGCWRRIPLPVAIERMRVSPWIPGQTGTAPSAGIDRRSRMLPIRLGEPVNIQETVEMIGLMLQHAGENLGTLDTHRRTIRIETRDSSPISTSNRKNFPGHRQTTLAVSIDDRRPLGDLRPFEPRIDNDAPAPRRLSTYFGTVVDEHAQ